MATMPLDRELLAQKYAASQDISALDARMIRSYLPGLSDIDILSIFGLFRAGAGVLGSDKQKQDWLGAVMGTFAQAKRSGLSAQEIKAVFIFLGKEVYPFLRRLNCDGRGGLAALPADQAVLLVNSLKSELAFDDIGNLLKILLERFPNNYATCKTAIDDLKKLKLSGRQVLQVVNLLRGYVEMDVIPRAVRVQLNTRSDEELVPLCKCLKITLPMSSPERYAVCLVKARAAVVPSQNINMVCVMWDPEVRDYFTGYNYQGQTYLQGHIPAGLWGQIPTQINPDAYQFGQGCAEVHCLTQAFAARNAVGSANNSLKGCVFAAFHPKEQKERPACTGCKKWLPGNGAYFSDRA